MHITSGRSVASAAALGALALTLAACGSSTSSSSAASGSSSSSGHRIGHETTFSYPAGDDSSMHHTLPGMPEEDFPGLHSLSCATHSIMGVPVAHGTIHNTTNTANDYSLEVDFYPGKGEAPAGSELARTYVQVYEVKPGDTVPYSTAEVFGQSHRLSGANFCVPAVIMRQTSSAASNVQTPAPSGACNLLTTTEVQGVAHTAIRASSAANNGNCSWEDANNTFYLLIAQTAPAEKPSFSVNFTAPCPGGSYGYSQGSLTAVCTGGKSGKPYYITFANPVIENQMPSANPYSQTLVNGIGNLIRQAMSRG